jgi:hypothetical protein
MSAALLLQVQVPTEHAGLIVSRMLLDTLHSLNTAYLLSSNERWDVLLAIQKELP